MQIRNLNKSGFALHVLIVFVVGTVAILILDLLAVYGLIAELTESVSRFLIWVFLILTLLWSASRVGLDKRTRIAGCFALGILLIEMGLGVLEDVPSLTDVPVVGRAAPSQMIVSKITTAGWTCGGLFLVYSLVSSLERQQLGLERRVKFRTRELTAANDNLKLEISHRRQAEENLKESESAVVLQQRVNQRLEAALLKLEETQEQLIQQERLSAVGQLARGLAHDLNNALTPVVAYSEQLLKSASSEQRRALEHVSRGAKHSAGIIKQLQFFCQSASWEDHQHEPVRLRDVIHGAIALTRPRWRDEAIQSGIEIDVRADVDDDLTVEASAVELTQLYTNLILNAVDAMPHGGLIFARASAMGDDITLEIDDSGAGMSDEVHRRCFEPYFSTRHNGSGLGLSVCHGIVERHGGDMDIVRSDAAGTCFRVVLPNSRSLDRHITSGDEDQAIGTGHCVLYIDDDDMARESIGLLLEELGLEVDLASSGAVGLDRLRHREYDLVITDLGMSGLTGVDVFRVIKEDYAETPVVVVSGWSRSEVLTRFGDGPVPDAIVEKPATVDAISAAMACMHPSKA